MSRVLLTRPLPDCVTAAAAAAFDVEQRDSTQPMKPAEMRAALALYDGVLATLGDRFDADILGGGTHRCKILANFGVGYDHIDTAAAAACGITVTNTPGAVTDATADIALTLILMSARRAGAGERLVRSGQWQGWHPTQMLGLHLGGRTVGIVGMGRIGQAIARRCLHGLGMKVIYHSRTPKDLDFAATRTGTLAALAARADVIVAAVPGGAETRHLICADVLAAMQPHAHFINISRGDVVDETALIAALQSGQIAGAGLDVYEHEPQVPAALMALENAVLLPHLGTAAQDVREAMGMLAVDNLRAFFAGDVPPNVVG
ncbi:D-glycerate dehydrogenase [Pelagivirga sediminicola]|uniref:D-glycerate dehydrogenase n=1 Tax=Pelagivirga sediminicola TaxID=2170575 RepID=A0A2T7G796_9RHOB|nr:D-glycerate dehydrogenase [Pelagivirga sediminicola]PVA10305.1 D-glycerate dehydrogenase [Pelagivirga sediminicola]